MTTGRVQGLGLRGFLRFRVLDLVARLRVHLLCVEAPVCFTVYGFVSWVSGLGVCVNF